MPKEYEQLSMEDHESLGSTDQVALQMTGEGNEEEGVSHAHSHRHAHSVA